MKKKMRLRDLLILQCSVIIYTISGVIGKFAARSAQSDQALVFLLLYGAEIAVLGVYAIIWQQMIKKFDLSVAYANRAVALLWSLLWASLIFGEPVTGKKALGVALVVLGTAVVNAGKGEKTGKCVR